jgi:7-carboxy-7-deazaguanine synthase
MKINEIFYSLQGEGILVGTPSIFLRTTGCNLRCSYCDTTYAYTQGKEMSISEILTVIKKYPCRNICITGGEPLLQKETPQLINNLLKRRYLVCLETNGSIPLKPYLRKPALLLSLDIKCPSSDSHTKMIMKNISSLSTKDQLKFVIKNKKDYHYAKAIVNKYSPSCTVFFQPVWGTNPDKLASWILKDALPVRLSLQIHKILWGTKRGV